MYKFLIVPILAIGLLAGCEDNPDKPNGLNINRVKSVEVVKKEEKGHYRASSDYYITVKKNGNVATFQVSETTYNMVSKKSVISGNQTSDGYLRDVIFPDLK
jgi:hypothetical protein